MRSTMWGLVLVGVLFGCGSDSASDDEAAFTRSTLPNGATHVRYTALPSSDGPALTPDLRIGTIDGAPEEIFGDVRSIEVGGDGTIYVLDNQASEIRTYGPDGAYLQTIATRGQGPGEISGANGMVLSGDSVLWVQDHGQWSFIALRPDGTEIERLPMHVRAYGWTWDGTVDLEGRVWKVHTITDPSAFQPEPGLVELERPRYFVSFEPRTGTRDSVLVGVAVESAVVARAGTRISWYPIPHHPPLRALVDPHGGFWLVTDEHYRLTRLDAQGDTVVVIEVDEAGPLVTADDRQTFIDGMLDTNPDSRGTAEEIADLMPERKPAIEALHVDDEGRLWVRAATEIPGETRYDVFDRDGTHRRVVRLAFEPNAFIPPRIRNGRFYALVTDDYDVHYVVGLSVPD